MTAFKQPRYRYHLDSTMKKHASDILSSFNFRTKTKCPQHGDMSVKNHCLDVARYSIAINEKLKIKCNERALVRGALLHDYFLYDWHKTEPDEEPHKLHGFYHPGTALRNAMKEYELSDIEKEIIKKHMWPLTPIPPMCKEAWVVTAADKWCSMLETVHLHSSENRDSVKRNVRKRTQKIATRNREYITLKKEP